MTNKDVAKLLEEIAVLLELAGENPFKSRSYDNMARTVSSLEENIEDLVAEKRLREIKGLGDALEQKITEYVTTGKLEYYEKLRAQFPEGLFELFAIPGLGAKRIKQLYDERDIDSLAALERALAEGRLEGMKGFGPKMFDKIREGIEFAKKHTGQHHIDLATVEGQRILEHLKEDKSVIRIEVAGSLRRRKEVVKDIDIIASSNKPTQLMNRFVEMDGVSRVTGHGETKSSIVLDSGMAADLRVVSDAQFPYALCHFTGSKEHNVAMRQRAKDRGLKLNEYGLFDDKDKNKVCKDEAAIYKALDLPFIPPELREDMGEFDAEQLPKLLEPGDLKGVVHCHSTYSDGKNTVEQMAKAAKERGYSYLGMADHSQSAAYAGGLLPAAVEKQQKEIDGLNKKLKGFRIFKGIESDIRGDGNLDYDDDILATFDFIVASVHSKLDMSQAEATKRIVKAVENPHTTILGHPTGRLLLQREGYTLDWEKVFDACVANRVAIEINAHPRRLDIDWRLIHRAKDKGIQFSIGPDAHDTEGFDVMTYGIGIARKGWLEKSDVLNCLTAQQFLKWKSGK